MARPTGTARLARALGARIRVLRLEKHLTQERLAWECDLDKGYMSQVESGKRLPTLVVLAALAKRLNVALADLVTFDLTSPRLRLLDAARQGDREAIRAALRDLDLL